LAALAGVAVWQGGAVVGQEPRKEVNPDALRHAQYLSEAFNDASAIATPSVVTIRSKTKAVPVSRGGRNGENPFKGTPFEQFFEGRDLEDLMPNMPNFPKQGMGSGVIIDPSGIVLTNNHVVDGADEVMVHLADGREYKAQEIKTDPKTDLALLYIKGAGTLPAAKLGDSDKLKIGDWVIAVGNPFELEQTVSAGIISGMGRDLSKPGLRARYLQTDAAINPGNSGGPLLNLHGEVVGINTAIATNTGSYSGIGFAIPINSAKWVTDQLMKSGTVARAWLGVGIKPLTPDLAAKFGAPGTAGALVTNVVPDAPAASAGFKAGDIVTKFGDQKIDGPNSLQQYVERVPPNTSQPVEVWRDGKAVTLQVTPEPLPKDIEFASHRGPATDDEPTPNRDAFAAENLGLEVTELTASMAKQVGLAAGEGVLISGVTPNSVAYEGRLRPGMVILKVGSKETKTVEQFKAALKEESLTDGILLYVYAGNTKDFVLLKE
jgi:serine protease Do